MVGSQTVNLDIVGSNPTGVLCCVLEQDIYSKKYWLISRKRWVDVTEKLLTGMLNPGLKLNK